LWHTYGMPRVRVSTTVDGDLLKNARSVREGTPDSALLDEALTSLISEHRAAEADASYAAYDEHPLTEVDEWGDLASFREAAAASGALFPPEVRSGGVNSLTSVVDPWLSSPEMRRFHASVDQSSRRVPPQFGACRAKCSSSLETTPSRGFLRSTSTRSRALRSAYSLSGLGVSRMPACERSAQR